FHVTGVQTCALPICRRDTSGVSLRARSNMSDPAFGQELPTWLRLSLEPGLTPALARALLARIGPPPRIYAAAMPELSVVTGEARSEERRVGNECGAG